MRKSLLTLAAAASLAAAPLGYAHHVKGHDTGNDCKTNCGVHLAVGQDAKLLNTTRISNAGAGNGSEPAKGKFGNEVRDLDPGNSGSHNRAAAGHDDPSCEFVKCDPLITK